MIGDSVDVAQYLTPKRLDVVIKGLYFEELQSGLTPFGVEDIYKQHIMKRTGGVEPVNYMGRDSDKHNVEDYVNRCKWMLANCPTSGFEIPISSNGEIIDGAHRVSELS